MSAFGSMGVGFGLSNIHVSMFMLWNDIPYDPIVINEQGCVIFRGLQIANIKSPFINSNHNCSYLENLIHNLLTLLYFIVRYINKTKIRVLAYLFQK